MLVADLGSFTRAAEVMDTSQAAISLKLKRLEARLGYRVLERTPCHVRLSPQGEGFIEPARDLLMAYERAVGGLTDAPTRRPVLGISDHVAGSDLPALLGRLASYDPMLLIEVRISPSRDLVAAFESGEVDAAIVRREGKRRDGEVLAEERFGWFASPTWQPRPGEPLRLATMAAPCGVRAVATRTLDAAAIAWTEVFIGSSTPGRDPPMRAGGPRHVAADVSQAQPARRCADSLRTTAARRSISSKVL